MNIKPIGNRIYIEPETKDSILVTTSLKKEKAKVLAIGKDVSEVKVGDMVIFTPWAVDSYEENGTKYYFIQEDATTLLATIEVS